MDRDKIMFLSLSYGRWDTKDRNVNFCFCPRGGTHGTRGTKNVFGLGRQKHYIYT